MGFQRTGFHVPRGFRIPARPRPAPTLGATMCGLLVRASSRVSRSMVRIASETIKWLLHGDPAVVWQVQRDLLVRAASTWKPTRRRVATEGWGTRLLSHRLYNPKWTSTFYTLRLLTQLGLPPNNREGVASCRLLIDKNPGRPLRNPGRHAAPHPAAGQALNQLATRAVAKADHAAQRGKS